MFESITVPRWAQGPTGQGQGGWATARMAQALPVEASFRLRAPIPLEVPLSIVTIASDGDDDDDDDGPWELRDGDTVIVSADALASIGDPLDDVATTAVTIDQAVEARRRHGVPAHEHPVPYCFSCGIQPTTMAVHPGPLDDGSGRYATDWTAPEWAARPDGTVDPAVTWAALDCTAAFYVCRSPVVRAAVTAQFRVRLDDDVAAGETYAIVAWPGGYPADWDGRKRHAASALFDPSGRCVGVAASFWIALD